MAGIDPPGALTLVSGAAPPGIADDVGEVADAPVAGAGEVGPVGCAMKPGAVVGACGVAGVVAVGC